MRTLHIALHAFRAQHAAIERELLPRLESDHLVVPHLQLNPALLAAEPAVRLHQPLRGIRRLTLPAARRLIVQMRTIVLDQSVSSIGGRAMKLLFHPQLGARERLAFARRTDVLPGSAGPACVVESQFRQHPLEVLDLHPRREPFAASRAVRPGIRARRGSDTASRRFVPVAERCERTCRTADTAAPAITVMACRMARNS